MMENNTIVTDFDCQFAPADPGNPDNITFSEAKPMIINWLNFSATYLEPNKLPLLRGFNIPLSDLFGLLGIPEVPCKFDGARAYLAIDESPQQPPLTSPMLKILLVPVLLDAAGNYNDQVCDKNSTNNYSLIYDFTTPCPPICGNESILNSLQSNL